jgi:hypothetical protein
MPDISNNPDVVKLVRELNKLGAKVEFFRENNVYGYMIILLKPALEQIVNKFNKTWKTDIAKVEFDKADNTVIYTLNFYDNYKIPDNKIKEIENFFLNHGILAVVSQMELTKLHIVLHINTYAKFIERKFVKRLNNSNAYFQYIGESQSLVIHIWTGQTPEKVKLLRQENTKVK